MSIRRSLFCNVFVLCVALLSSVFAGLAPATVFAQSTQPTLKSASGSLWLIGTAVTAQQLRNPKIVDLVTEQFDYLTGEFEFFPQFLHPDPDRYTFERADRVADFAMAHHLPLTGHMLCWGQFTPAWMFEGPDHRPLDRDRALANLKNHIDTVVAHFKGKVTSWDVVNEAISDAPGEYLRDTPARRAIGDDYVAKAFEYAHDADPDVKLYYNDYNIEDPIKLPKTIKLIRSLRESGHRVDAVGIQGHWLLNFPSAEVIDAALGALSKEKIKVMITELDIDVLPRGSAGADLAHIQAHGENPYPSGLPPEVADAESRRYASIFRVFKAHADEISAITFWGVHDGQSWLNGFPIKGRTNYPLLFDRNLQPKPAYQAVIDVLRGK